MNTPRKPYPTDVSDAEWQFVLPYLTLRRLDAPQRDHDLRAVFNALRWLARAGAGWRLLPHDLPPWAAVYQQSQRWIRAEVFDQIAHDLRVLLRLAAGRAAEPTAAIFDSRTLQSSVKSGARAGYDGYKRKRGSKLHLAVDTLGHFLARSVTPANTQIVPPWTPLPPVCRRPRATRSPLHQGYTGEKTARAAGEHGIALDVVKLADAKRGFVLLPRRWLVERDFAWTTRFRRLVRDYERLPETLAGLHLVAFVFLMLQRAFPNSS